MYEACQRNESFTLMGQARVARAVSKTGGCSALVCPSTKTPTYQNTCARQPRPEKSHAPQLPHLCRPGSLCASAPGRRCSRTAEACSDHRRMVACRGRTMVAAARRGRRMVLAANKTRTMVAAAYIARRTVAAPYSGHNCKSLYLPQPWPVRLRLPGCKQRGRTARYEACKRDERFGA